MEKIKHNHSLNNTHHRTIIKQGRHVRKSLAICATQLAGGVLLKKIKHFEILVNIF